MTREVGGRGRSRVVTVLVVVATLLAGALLAGLIGTASAAPADEADRGSAGNSEDGGQPGEEGRSGEDGSGGDGKSGEDGGDGGGDPDARAEGRAEGTPCSTEARACVDRARRTAWLIKDGVVEVGPVPAAPGGQGHSTPLGTFQVEWKNKDHRSAEFDNAPMPYAVFFAPGGIAFHEGSTESPSAGCVRLAHDDAVRWFDTLQVGDRVEVHE